LQNELLQIKYPITDIILMDYRLYRKNDINNKESEIFQQQNEINILKNNLEEQSQKKIINHLMMNASSIYM
jgi:hypothetical protein